MVLTAIGPFHIAREREQRNGGNRMLRDGDENDNIGIGRGERKGAMEYADQQVRDDTTERERQWVEDVCLSSSFRSTRVFIHELLLAVKTSLPPQQQQQQQQNVEEDDKQQQEQRNQSSHSAPSTCTTCPGTIAAPLQQEQQGRRRQPLSVSRISLRSRVEVTGIVVEAEHKPKMSFFAVDDGTGSVGCILWLPPPGLGNASQHVAAATARETVVRRVRSLCVRVGAVVRVQGVLGAYRSDAQIRVVSMQRLLSPDDEARWWMDVVHLGTHVYRSTSSS